MSNSLNTNDLINTHRSNDLPSFYFIFDPLIWAKFNEKTGKFSNFENIPIKFVSEKFQQKGS